MHPNWYERHILPRALDYACGMPMVGRMRQLVVPRAQGRVLEVGIGTGLNMRYYDQSRVTHITGLDPALQLHPLARERIAQSGLKVELVGLSAEKIPLPNASFDTVLITYTLCTIPNPHAALLEMRRVLAPTGKLLYCEHGRAPDASVQRWQERLQPLWGPVAGGCQLGRDIPALLILTSFQDDSNCGTLRESNVPRSIPMARPRRIDMELVTQAQVVAAQA
ncbi:class I SAM-dependent methyltransferase, partial [Rhodoferax sp.]|uniref:class I SAM-dependent methyltransferase n=1 Tax=Rhodoferax sp. TaxID=50421 RepID=UPI0027532A21|nr:class I SAM-dependent methyltransferase [Rhodoferax sp.]